MSSERQNCKCLVLLSLALDLLQERTAPPSAKACFERKRERETVARAPATCESASASHPGSCLSRGRGGAQGRHQRSSVGFGKVGAILPLRRSVCQERRRFVVGGGGRSLALEECRSPRRSREGGGGRAAGGATGGRTEQLVCATRRENWKNPRNALAGGASRSGIAFFILR
jgi:hypothetical protein